MGRRNRNSLPKKTCCGSGVGFIGSGVLVGDEAWHAIHDLQISSTILSIYGNQQYSRSKPLHFD